MRTYLVAILAVFLSACGTSDTLPQDQSSGMSVMVEMDAASAQSTFQNLELNCTNNLAASAGYSVLASGASISGSGNFQYRATQVASIASGFGNVFLFGQGAGAKVASVGNFNGNLFLCGMSVGSISGFANGNVLAQGGIDSIANSSGNFFLYADNFPSVSKFFGNVVIKTSGGQYRGRTYSVP